MRARLSRVAIVLMIASASLLARERDPVTTREEVLSYYDALADLTLQERKSLLSTLPASLQQDLWILHLQRFLAGHPELTIEQRSIVYEGIGLMAAGLIESRDPNVSVDARVQHLDRRARVTYSRALMAEAFIELGGPSPHRVDVAAANNRPFRATANSEGSECHCASTSDYCDWWCGNNYFCALRMPGPRGCTWHLGCGTFWQYWCDGWCCWAGNCDNQMTCNPSGG